MKFLEFWLSNISVSPVGNSAHIKKVINLIPNLGQYQLIHKHLECKFCVHGDFEALGWGGEDVDTLLNICSPTKINKYSGVRSRDLDRYTASLPLLVPLFDIWFFRLCHIMMKMWWCTTLLQEECVTMVFLKQWHQPQFIMSRYAVHVMGCSAKTRAPYTLFMDKAQITFTFGLSLVCFLVLWGFSRPHTGTL